MEAATVKRFKVLLKLLFIHFVLIITLGGLSIPSVHAGQDKPMEKPEAEHFTVSSATSDIKIDSVSVLTVIQFAEYTRAIAPEIGFFKIMWASSITVRHFNSSDSLSLARVFIVFFRILSIIFLLISDVIPIS